MTKKETKPRLSRIHSMRYGLFAAIVTGAVIASAVYILLRFTFSYLIGTYYVSDENRNERERALVGELQSYIEINSISSQDTGEFTKWARKNRYVHLLLYKDDELFYNSGNIGTGDTPLPTLPGGGITVDYPDYEELLKYAEENDLYTLKLKDGALFASVSDFTEYLYYDLSNMVSLGAAMLALAIAMILYFRRVLARITRLAQDVTVVSDGNMHHNIRYEGDDELARLSYNVEMMRSSMLRNIELEREARDSNAQLITSMSHDIRTPLTVLLGYLEMLKQSPHGEELDDYIKASHTTALRLKKLSDDMFKYALVFGGADAAVELSEYRASVLVEQLLAEHLLLLAERGYDIEPVYEWVGDDADSLVLTDPPNLMRIVDNVFSNIAKYADKNAPVRFSVILNGDRLTLSFANKPRRDLSGVESNGIGLKTCNKLAEALGHEFSYESGEECFEAKLGFAVINRNGEEHTA